MRNKILGISVHPWSHRLEWNGVRSIAPALRATDYKCPHCFFFINGNKTAVSMTEEREKGEAEEASRGRGIRYALGRTNSGRGETMKFHPNPYFNCVTASPFLNRTQWIVEVKGNNGLSLG